MTFNFYNDSLKACIKNIIGFEIEKEYCDISEERLANAEVEAEQMNIFQIPQEGNVDDKTSN